MGIELMQGLKTCGPGLLKDMIDHLIAGYSTSLVVLIDTITSSGLHSGLLMNPDPEKKKDVGMAST